MIPLADALVPAVEGRAPVVLVGAEQVVVSDEDESFTDVPPSASLSGSERIKYPKIGSSTSNLSAIYSKLSGFVGMGFFFFFFFSKLAADDVEKEAVEEEEEEEEEDSREEMDFFSLCLLITSLHSSTISAITSKKLSRLLSMLYITDDSMLERIGATQTKGARF